MTVNLSNSLPNICVVGPGGLGLLLTCKFAPQHKTSLLTKQEHVHALEYSSLTISGTQSEVIPSKRVTLITKNTLSELPVNTSFWLCVKAYDLDNVLEVLKPHLSSAHSLVLCQNGLNIFLQATEQLGRTVPIIRVLPTFGLRKVSASEVALSGNLIVTIASMHEHERQRDQVKRILEGVDAQVTVEKDIATAEWKKVVVNILVNPICSIVNDQNSAVLEYASLRQLAQNVHQELQQVAQADGFDLPPIEDYLHSIENHAENINSTLSDLRQGKKTELDYTLARFLSIAASYEIKTPHCETLYHLLHTIEEISMLNSGYPIPNS